MPAALLLRFKIFRWHNFDRVVALCQYMSFFPPFEPCDQRTWLLVYCNLFDVVIILIMVRFFYIDYRQRYSPSLHDN